MILTFASIGCGVDSILFGELTRGDQVEVPGAGVTEISGTAPGMAGSGVAFSTGAGVALESLGTTVSPDAAFTSLVPGSAEYTNLVITIESGAAQAWGVVPKVAKKTDVFEPNATVLAGELGADSTFATLLVLAKARNAETPLATVASGAVRQALQEVVARRDEGVEAFVALSSMLDAIRASATAPPLRPFPPGAESYLATGDAAAFDTAAFDAALDAALDAFEFHACYPQDRVRLVLIADLRDGGQDRNCTPIDAFKWAKAEPGKSMFVTGGIHKDTPRCGEAEPPCLDDAAIDEGNKLLGNWTPNQVRMYDDGTNGDAKADDGVWTLALDFPWLDPGAGPGVRIGYKYTFGHPAQLWTESEEWPGNKRILELRDVNGDHVITRRDLFGDETTNKDKSNALLPSHGGCGTVVFPGQDAPAFCQNDAVEAQIDTDGDCVLDTWPAPGVAGPISVDCPE